MIGPVVGVAEPCTVVSAAPEVSVSVQLPGVQLTRGLSRRQYRTVGNQAPAGSRYSPRVM